MLLRSKSWGTLVLASSLMGSIACESSAPTGAAASAPAPTAAAEPSTPGASDAPTRRRVERVTSYPKARWRLADAAELQHVVLWVSHILIRHRDVPPLYMPFKGRAWPGAPDAPRRSREEAQRMAESIAAEASSETFARLAEQHSEDIASRPFGGSLGGVVAGHLIAAPEVLDALAALKPGQVSRVVESIYGFHVLLRRAPPAEQTVSGSRIVIGYDQASWLEHYKRGSKRSLRSRSEAFEIAQRAYAEAQKAPDAFARLVDEYTEHLDAATGGDIGSWSTHEEVPFPRELEVLQGLAVGAVAAPVDTALGIQILRREPNRTRQEYALASISFPFDRAAAPEEAGSPESALERARTVAGKLLRNPDRFEELRLQYDARSETLRWFEGRAYARFESALRPLGPGQIAGEPIRDDMSDSFILAQRQDAARLPALAVPAVRFELPSPVDPDVAYLVTEGIGAVRAKQLLAEQGEKVLASVSGLTGSPEQEELRGIIHKTAGDMSRQEISSALGTLAERAKSLLGDAAYAEYEAAMNLRLEALVLRDGAS